MELKKEDIQILRTKSKASSQVTFDVDYNVPDVKPDIGRMIQNKGEMTVEEVRLNEGHAFLKGKLQADLLYVGEEDGRIYSLSANLPMEETLNLDGIVNGDKMCLKWEIEDLSIHIIHSRKMNIKAVVTFFASAEMLEFGQDYAKQIVKNSKALAQSLYERGFDVLCEELGFTESHQLAINVSNIRSASDIARDLANNDVILNKNLLPGDDVNDSDNPSGLRIGTQEITRRGLKEKEMDEVAEFIKRVAVDKENIKDEVREFMDQYTTVHYSFSQNEGYRFHKL